MVVFKIDFSGGGKGLGFGSVSPERELRARIQLESLN